MRKKVIIILLLLLLVNTGTGFAQSAGESSLFSIEFIGQFVGATYTSVMIHEAGHYDEANIMGVTPTIHLGFMKQKSGDGSSHVSLGETRYERYPQDAKKKSRLALAGIESSHKIYESLNNQIINGQANSRFDSMVALFCKTDFPRYAFIHSLTENPGQANDLECYITNSGADKEFIYTAAFLDVVFNLPDIEFHIKNVLGMNSQMPKLREICGFKTQPRVFVERYAGIAIGFDLSKKW
ncbi:MAG: hypothetical protein GY853_12930 [PVC group bacterium]|nr:hypothetical protein [PVC group bacterium]